MTAPPMFPSLGGQKFAKRVPFWKGGRIVESVSGDETRSQTWAAPRYAWEVSFDGVCSDDSHPGLTPRSRQMLEDLYHRCGGKYGSTFLYTDPDDCEVSGQEIGVGDGATTSFVFQRTLIHFSEPVGWVTSVDAVYSNGLPIDAGWTLVEPNSLAFDAAPAASAVITADFHFAFKCRWDIDEMEFQGFLHRIAEVPSIRFVSVRT